MKFFKSEKKYDPRINYNDQLLFIHIPKTGGTSVVQTLGFKSPTHIKAKEIYNSSCRKLLAKRYTFSVVRNPISRFVSLYNYSRMEISTYHNNKNPEKSLHGVHMDYLLLKDTDINDCVNLLLQGKLTHDSSWNQWEPQYTWLYNDDGKLLVKKTFQLEALALLEHELTRRLKRAVTFPKLNTSKNAVNQNISLTENSLAILRDYYSKDFDLLGY